MCQHRKMQTVCVLHESLCKYGIIIITGSQAAVSKLDEKFG